MGIRYGGGFCGPLEFGYPFRYFALPVVPSILISPGTHDTSILALMFSSMKVITVSTDFCDVCRLSPGLSFVIALNEDVLVYLDWTQTDGTQTITRLRSIPLPR